MRKSGLWFLWASTLGKAKVLRTSSLTDSRRNSPWIYGKTWGCPSLMPSPASGGARERSPLKELHLGSQRAQHKLSKSSGAWASWEVRQCSDMILGHQCFNFWECSEDMSHNHLHRQVIVAPGSLAKKQHSLNPKGFILVGSLEAFPWKGNYIFWESLLGKSRVTFVPPRQMQPSRKLFECCVTPLPVPAPGDIQISTQGICTSSGYSAMMEKFKVLLGMLDAHKPDLDANPSWL